MNKNIIFDLDGTILDSKKEIINTYKKVIESIPIQKEIDLNTIDHGAPLNKILDFLYDSDLNKITLAKKTFSANYDHSNYIDTYLYPSVYETLMELAKQRFKLYIATNKRFSPTIRMLEIKKLRHYFIDIYANEMIPNVTLSKSTMIRELKRIHQFDSGYMVGDTIGDITSGNENGLDTIAVTYGYEPIEKLKMEAPTFIINSFNDILSIALSRK